MRSLKIIAQDMRAMADLLHAGAKEIEEAARIDSSALTSLIGLFQGGVPTEVSRPTPKQNQPSENTRSAEPQEPKQPRAIQHHKPRPVKAILTIQDRATMRLRYQELLNQNWTKDSAFARIQKTWPQCHTGQLKAILFNDMRKAIDGQLAKKAAQKNG